MSNPKPKAKTARRPKAPPRAAPPPPTPPQVVTAADVLMQAATEAPERVIVIYEKGGQTFVLGSPMHNSAALWMVKRAEMNALGIKTES